MDFTLIEDIWDIREDTIDFYYFSGTGNTLLVVKKMRDTFEEKGVNVNLHKIEESNPKDVNLEHIIGLAFPVAVFSTYPFVWDFMESLPHANGTKIFMVDTLGGFSGGIVGPLRRIIEKKGYFPMGATEIQMPSNIFYIQDEDTNQNKIQKGLIKAKMYAWDIINGSAEWGRNPLLSDAMYLFSRGALKLTEIDLHQKYFLFKVDEKKCDKCRICDGLCPVGNIKMEPEEFPSHGLNCQYCMRCASFCPKQAISSKFNYKGKLYRAIDILDFYRK